jgi:hypothetical protein
MYEVKIRRERSTQKEGSVGKRERMTVGPGRKRSFRSEDENVDEDFAIFIKTQRIIL